MERDGKGRERFESVRRMGQIICRNAGGSCLYYTCMSMSICVYVCVSVRGSICMGIFGGNLWVQMNILQVKILNCIKIRSNAM